MRARCVFGQKCRGYANRQSGSEQTFIPLRSPSGQSLDIGLHAKESDGEEYLVSSRQHLLHHGKTKSAYKWLKRGALDPDRGFEWPIGPVPRTAPVTTPPSAVHAYLPAGIAYEVDDELWEVVLQDVIGYQPFPHQKTDGGLQPFEEQEQSIFALSGYLVRRIQEWTLDVAEEFTRECALETKARALRALHDAAQWLEDAHATEQANGSTLVGASGELTPTAWEPHPHEREAIVLGQAQRLLSIWCSARAANGSQAQIAAAHAAAAAASRSAAAVTYATAIDPGEIDAATKAAARAYAAERRRQARWLQERLGLKEPDVGSVARDVA
jgi:hypothetical protein